MQFKLGDVVTCNFYPVDHSKDIKNLSVAGEPEHLPPLMVVTELLNPISQDELNKLNEKEQDEAINKIQAKCTWFSDRTFLFHETWFKIKFLKQIITNTKFDEIPSVGSNVIFATQSFELQKTKISLKQTGIQEGLINSSISGLVSYSTPILQVMEIEVPKELKNKRKDNCLLSVNYIKCRYFNYRSDKYSETIQPIEAFILFQPTPQQKMDFLFEGIRKGNYFSYENSSLSRKSILKPLHIKYVGGAIILLAKDYLINKQIEILVDNNIEQFISLDSKLTNNLPKFNNDKGKLIISAVNITNLKLLDQKKYWRIRYRDISENITIRTIYNPKFIIMEVVNEEGEVFLVDFLEANCISKNDEVRYFSINRILEVQEMNLTYPLP